MNRRTPWLSLVSLICLLLAAASAAPPAARAYPQSVEISPYYTEGTAPLNVNFSTSAYDMQGFLQYEWGFGDGGSFSGNGRHSQGSSVNHTYTEPGFYYVSLGVCTDWGECDSAYAYVRVNEP